MLLFLFQDRDTDLFALSRDKVSANIPRLDISTRWLMLETVESVRLVDGWELADFIEAIVEIRMKGSHVFRGRHLRPERSKGERESPSRRDLAGVASARGRRASRHQVGD